LEGIFLIYCAMRPGGLSQLDPVDRSSVRQDIRTYSKEGSSEHFPPLSTNAIFCALLPSVALAWLQ